MDNAFLPGIPVAHVLQRLEAAGGNEVASGKLAHPESSAALAVNAFGWFVERPELFVPLPATQHAGRAERVELEYCARFPWAGGRHPWLDAAVFTDTHLIGVESKRYEPFRDAKSVSLPASYDRPVWGDNMARYGAMRDSLRSGLAFKHLDAAQLVKHAYGLVTEGRRLGKSPKLFYVFAEPAARAGVDISDAARARHRAEIAEFASAVDGDEVQFASCSYREWIMTWATESSVVEHGEALQCTFAI
ncbi:MAG: PGN_0703 family putative restriction endonuclease [Janthinobacterium lividum]